MPFIAQNLKNRGTKGGGGQVVSKFKLGHTEYSKTVFESKKFFSWTPGPAKLACQKKGVSQNLEFFNLDQNWSPKVIERVQCPRTVLLEEFLDYNIVDNYLPHWR